MKRHVHWLAILIGSMLALGAAGGPGVIVKSLSWQATDFGPLLQIAFEGPDPALELFQESWGVGIRLQGAKLAAPPCESVQGSSEDGDLVLRVQRPGASIQGFRLGGGTIDLRLGKTLTGTGAVSGYRVGPGDVLSVMIYKNPDLSGDFTVTPDGTINIPLAGRVPVAGRSDDRLGEAVRDALSAYLVDPQVAVSVKTYQSQFVHVAGSVAKATRIPLRPGMTLKDVLSEAGVALIPGQRLTITSAGPDSSREPVVLDQAALEEGRVPAPRDGDVLTVEEPKWVYVYGEVRLPGKYPLSTGMTLLQSLAMAQGLTDWASPKGVRILRTENGESEELSFDLGKIEQRKIEDPPLKPGDVIRVKRRIL